MIIKDLTVQHLSVKYKNVSIIPIESLFNTLKKEMEAGATHIKFSADFGLIEFDNINFHFCSYAPETEDEYNKRLDIYESEKAKFEKYKREYERSEYIRLKKIFESETTHNAT